MDEPSITDWISAGAATVSTVAIIWAAMSYNLSATPALSVVLVDQPHPRGHPDFCNFHIANSGSVPVEVTAINRSWIRSAKGDLGHPQARLERSRPDQSKRCSLWIAPGGRSLPIKVFYKDVPEEWWPIEGRKGYLHLQVDLNFRNVVGRKPRYARFVLLYEAGQLKAAFPTTNAENFNSQGTLAWWQSKYRIKPRSP